VPPSEAPPPPREAGQAASTILVVDDTEDVLDLAVHHLSARGYRVLSARSGEEALALLTAADRAVADLLFTDIAMPGGMNGLMLAEQARALCPGLRVLFATGYSEDLATGMPPRPDAAVLSKPYGEADLATAVKHALGASRREHPQQAAPGREEAGPA
jgi:CheY-like chemotaxis protein